MIQNGDFIRINYTGKLAGNAVFDTTVPEIAKATHLRENDERPISPVVICVGEGMIIPGLDAALIGRTPGRFSVTFQPEQAFGRKDARLIKIIPLAQLHKQQIQPYPGLQLNIDGNYGVVRSVSSGRTVVDFNHPLAGQEVTYDVEVLAIVEDVAEQVKALLIAAGLQFKDVTVDGTHALVTMESLLPQPVLDVLSDRITSLTSLKTVAFEQGTRPAANAA